jgi:hypothetical protein
MTLVWKFSSPLAVVLWWIHPSTQVLNIFGAVGLFKKYGRLPVALAHFAYHFFANRGGVAAAAVDQSRLARPMPDL